MAGRGKAVGCRQDGVLARMTSRASFMDPISHRRERWRTCRGSLLYAARNLPHNRQVHGHMYSR